MIHTLDEDLDLVIALTKHKRFRQLVDPDHPDYQPGYVATIHAMAESYRANQPPKPIEPVAPPPPEIPSLITRIGNFASSVVAHVAQGMPTLEPEAVEARLAVCNGPPEGPPCDQRSPGGVCAGCGCYVNLKATWSDQVCPLGKWPT